MRDYHTTEPALMNRGIPAERQGELVALETLPDGRRALVHAAARGTYTLTLDGQVTPQASLAVAMAAIRAAAARGGRP